MPTHTNAWSDAAPLDADDINQGAAEMRKFRLDVDERMDVDHDWPSSTDGGYHTAVHLKEQAGDPANVVNCGITYTKDDGGDTELFYEDDSANVVQITKDGFLNFTPYSTIAAAQREEITRNAGGKWYECWWGSTTTVIFRVKAYNGMTPWVGIVLNNGKYLESTSNITLTLAPPAGGQILDGITAVLNNEWYVAWFYENAGGALAVGATWMPRTTFSTNNPTTALSVNQVNTQDIGLLFSPSADLLVWNASAKFETWRYNTASGATPTGACYLSSRIATVLTLDGALTVNNFSANDYVVQLTNFKPLAVDDGLIVDVIGTRGYLDSGLRMRTDGSAQIIQFAIHDNEFLFANGTGAADYAYNEAIERVVTTNAWAVYRPTHIPPDKTGIIGYQLGYQQYAAEYYATYGAVEVDLTQASTGIRMYLGEHGLIKLKNPYNGTFYHTKGYVL